MNRSNKKVLLLHGWGGKKEKHWLSFIEKELLKSHYDVSFPKIPNQYNPNREKWVNYVENHLLDFKADIVIAHSLGVLTWWHFYHRSHYKLQQLIAVAPPTFPSFPSKMSTFFPLPDMSFDEGVQTIIYAQNDPNIEQDKIKALALKMKSNLFIKKEGEHLDHYAKVETLPEVLKIIGQS